MHAGRKLSLAIFTAFALLGSISSAFAQLAPVLANPSATPGLSIAVFGSPVGSPNARCGLCPTIVGQPFLGVNQGGTGVQSLPANSLLLGHGGTLPVGAITPSSAGRLLMDMGPGVDPQFISLFGAISVAPTGQVTLTSSGTVTTAGTGLSLSGDGSTLNLALTNATLQANPAAGTSFSTTNIMQGTGVTTCRITPVYSGRLKIEYYGTSTHTTATALDTIQLRFGTGTGPAVAAAATGTQIGANSVQEMPAAGGFESFALGGIVTGLTPGTAVWIDIATLANGATGNVSNLSCNAFEF